MKKLFILNLLMACSFYVAQAQTTIKPAIGINVSDFSTDANGDAQGKAGYQIGASIAFGKKFYIEPGLFYVGKTTEITTTGTTSSTSTIDLKGMRIPLTLGLNLLGNEKSILSLRGFAGASAFFITSDSGIPATVDLNKTNFGVFAGAGLDIWKIFVDASYEWSVTDIQKNTSQIDWGKTRGIFINAGIRINL